MKGTKIIEAYLVIYTMPYHNNIDVSKNHHKYFLQEENAQKYIDKLHTKKEFEFATNVRLKTIECEINNDMKILVPNSNIKQCFEDTNYGNIHLSPKNILDISQKKDISVLPIKNKKIKKIQKKKNKIDNKINRLIEMKNNIKNIDKYDYLLTSIIPKFTVMYNLNFDPPKWSYPCIYIIAKKRLDRDNINNNIRDTIERENAELTVIEIEKWFKDNGYDLDLFI